MKLQAARQEFWIKNFNLKLVYSLLGLFYRGIFLARVLRALLWKFEEIFQFPLRDYNIYYKYDDVIHNTVSKMLKAPSLYRKWNEMNRALGHLCAHIG